MQVTHSPVHARNPFTALANSVGGRDRSRLAAVRRMGLVVAAPLLIGSVAGVVSPMTATAAPLAAVAVPSVSAAAAATTSVSASVAAAAKSNVWDRVAACESGGGWRINTHNGYYGGLQFSPSSWRAAGGAKYAGLPHQATRTQQILTAKVLLRMQGPGAWPVCSRRAGLTRANGAAAPAGPTVKKVASTRARAHVTKSQARTVQRWVGGKQTGFWSKTTTRQLQRVIRAKQDGIIGKATVGRVEILVGAKRTGLPHFNKATLAKLVAYARTH